MRRLSAAIFLVDAVVLSRRILGESNIKVEPVQGTGNFLIINFQEE